VTVGGTLAAGNTISTSAGGLSVTGNSTIAGTLGSLTGLTSSGTITFSGLNTAGVVLNSSSGVLSTLTNASGSNGDVLTLVGGVPAWTASAGGGGAQIFGTGDDCAHFTGGAVTLTGTTAATVTASSALNANIYCTTLTINANQALTTNGFQIFVSGTLTINSGANINLDGAAGGNAASGVTGTAGFCPNVTGVMGCGGAGGVGGSAGVGAVGAAANPGQGAAGGAGGTTNSAGGAAGAVTAPTNAEGSLRNPAQALTGKVVDPLNNNLRFMGGSGGGGGGSQNTSNRGGGGGAGAGVVFVAANTISNSGTIQANGGKGGNGFGTGAGGGGGGGGFVMVLYRGGAPGTLSAAGGAAGTGGTIAAAAGSAGFTYSFVQ
jgi:hypothetical protein